MELNILLYSHLTSVFLKLKNTLTQKPLIFNMPLPLVMLCYLILFNPTLYKKIKSHSSSHIKKDQEFVEKNIFLHNKNNHHPQFLNRVIEIIDSNLSENLTIEFISKKLNLTTHTFLRKIKKCTGYTSIGFVKEYRLQKAVELLKKQKDFTIKEIAFSIGYSSLPYFYSEFKKKYHMSPKKYQEKYTTIV